jgi:hypothetical protein
MTDTTPPGDHPVQTSEPEPSGGAGLDIDWRVVLRGALVGLAIIVPVTVLRVVLDREITDFDDSGWIYPLFVLILVGYATAGWVAGRSRPDAPLAHGALAGLGVLVLWIPIRIVIWAVREDGRGLVSGDHAALSPGQLFGAFVIAATLAMLGAVLAARITTRRAT